MQTEKPKTLYVQTFREFALYYDGKPILGLSRYGNTQKEALLQLLLHYRHTGVSRYTLLREMFEARDIIDASHSLHVALYNLRSKLRDAGLPDVNYIYRKGDAYWWTDEIPVEEDASTFEQLCEAAQSSQSSTERKRLYTEAFHLYRGEFLESHPATWTVQETKRYERLYMRCVESLAEAARAEKDPAALEGLGQQAAQAQPFWGWERLMMEALLAQGQMQRARRLLLSTKRYYQEAGMPIDEQMQALFSSDRSEDGDGVPSPEQLSNNLTQPMPSGGYQCGYDAFAGLCEMAKRWSRNAVLLSTLTDPDAEDELLPTIKAKLCPCDAICQTDDGRLFLLMADKTLAACRQWTNELSQHCKRSGVSAPSNWHILRIGTPKEAK